MPEMYADRGASENAFQCFRDAALKSVAVVAFGKIHKKPRVHGWVQAQTRGPTNRYESMGCQMAERKGFPAKLAVTH